MIRRCVADFVLVLLLVITIENDRNNNRCRDNNPKSEIRRNVKCPKFQVGRATPVSAIVSAGRDGPPYLRRVHYVAL